MRGLPGTRAVVGGLLVAVAALGTWYVASGADQDAGTSYVVASRAIGPGEKITSSHLALSSVELPDVLSSGAFTDIADLVDSVALGPIGPGELVQASSVATTHPSNVAELSFSVEADWAVGGALDPGDLIDLFHTDQRGGPGSTRRVLSAATILSIDRPEDTLGRQRTITITVGIDDPSLLPDAVGATRNGTISVVRVTGAAPPKSSRDDQETEDDAAGDQETAERDGEEGDT